MLYGISIFSVLLLFFLIKLKYFIEFNEVYILEVILNFFIILVFFNILMMIVFGLNFVIFFNNWFVFDKIIVNL